MIGANALPLALTLTLCLCSNCKRGSQYIQEQSTRKEVEETISSALQKISRNSENAKLIEFRATQINSPKDKIISNDEFPRFSSFFFFKIYYVKKTHKLKEK